MTGSKPRAKRVVLFVIVSFPAFFECKFTKPNRAKQKASAFNCTGLKRIRIYAFTYRKFKAKLR